MKLKTSIKVGGYELEFLKRLRTNRRKAEIDEYDSSYSELLELIAKFFKSDSEAYMKIVNMEATNNV